MLASLDVFALYGLFLAALGMRKVARLSPGQAWTIVLALWLVGVVIRIALALVFGRVIG
jgi:dipeptide/tripeptide permease